MYPVRAIAATAVILAATGCHSAYIEADLINQTPTPITLVELDYPSASFGTQTLAPGQHFHYRFKVLGSGPLKLIYTDAAHKEIMMQGPTLNEGDEGPLVVTIKSGATDWMAPRTNSRH